MSDHCNLGVGCEEYGVCYAEAHNQPCQCGRRDLPTECEDIEDDSRTE
jgi:hypothetical protein